MFSNANNTHKVDAIDPFSLISLVHQLSRPTKHAHLQLHSAVAILFPLLLPLHDMVLGAVKYETKQESVNPFPTRPCEFPLRNPPGHPAQQAQVHGQPSEMDYFNPLCNYKTPQLPILTAQDYQRIKQKSKANPPRGPTPNPCPLW